MKGQVLGYNTCKTFFVVGFKKGADEGMPKITFSR